jgi:hypothetical protein
MTPDGNSLRSSQNMLRLPTAAAKSAKHLAGAAVRRRVRERGQSGVLKRLQVFHNS